MKGKKNSFNLEFIPTRSVIILISTKDYETYTEYLQTLTVESQEAVARMLSFQQIEDTIKDIYHLTFNGLPAVGGDNIKMMIKIRRLGCNVKVIRWPLWYNRHQ